MIIVNKKKYDMYSKREDAMEGVVKKIISILGQVFVVGWVGLFMLWTKPFLTDYYQSMANSHYDSLGRWFQMGSVLALALFFSIHNIINKKYFIAVLTIIIAIWSFYWAFLAGPFQCHACTYGG